LKIILNFQELENLYQTWKAKVHFYMTKYNIAILKLEMGVT